MRVLLYLTILSAVCLQAAGNAQHVADPGQPFCQPLPYVDSPTNVSPPPDWYSGDTHDHIQLCDSSLLSTQDVLDRLFTTDLDVSSVLIWNGNDTLAGYTNQVCIVSGDPEPTPPAKVIQYGVETSGLECASWGHLVGLNVAADEARIAFATPSNGSCYTSLNGLGLGCPGGDGTGVFSAPIADHFANRPKAVRGVAHQAWPTGIYQDSQLGYDWYPLLVQTNRTEDAVCLDKTRRLTFPIVEILNQPQVLAPFAAMDVALGKVEYLEAVDMESSYDSFSPLPTRWYGAYYKLLSAGLRVSAAAGSDVDCADITGRTSMPRTYVMVEGGLTYDGWTEGLDAGRVTLAMGNDLFLRMSVENKEIGSQIAVSSPNNRVRVRATLSASAAVEDSIELVVNGEVVATKAISIPASGGLRTLDLPELELTESSWLAARLCSNRAHTGATYVTVDNRPIAGCEEAEYWMVWCDLLTLTIEQFPLFKCQENDVLAHLTRARRVFKSLRDYATGFNPLWQVDRRGGSSPSCLGPIAIGLTGPVLEQAGGFTLNCLNAPPRATGFAYVSDRPPIGGVTSFQGVPIFFDPTAEFLEVVPAVSRRNGTALTPMPILGEVPAGTKLYAQYLWANPPGCAGNGPISASDALEITVLPRPTTPPTGLFQALSPSLEPKGPGSGGS